MIHSQGDRVVVQGMTGRQGSHWTRVMRDSGTNVVAGVSPNKGGTEVDGVPIYGSVVAAATEHDLDATVLFVPPLSAKSATLDALNAGIKLVVLLAEHIPTQDTMEILSRAKELGAMVLGPNTAGLVVPGVASLGIMPSLSPDIFWPGSVGVLSRSGSLGTLMCGEIVRAGYGQSVFLGIGGDPIIGTPMTDALRILDRDTRTEAIVLVGEVGGGLEEEAADVVQDLSAPVVAYIAGRMAPPGRRMGHAGAIVTGSRGRWESKVAALGRAGATVLDMPSDVGAALNRAMG